jgi:hypothetical protein
MIEYRRDRLGKPFTSLGDETISAIISPAPIDEEITENDPNNKVAARIITIDCK